MLRVMDGMLPAPRNLGGYGTTVVWLRDRGLSVAHIANLLGIQQGYARQLDYRGRRLKSCSEVLSSKLLVDTGIATPPSRELRNLLGIREEEDSVVLSPVQVSCLQDLEDDLEACASGFWSGVRFQTGIDRFREFLPKTGYPSQVCRIRLRARIHELCSETYLHFGKILSALNEGLRAYQLYRVAFHESEDRRDLSQVARLARIVSQSFLLRRERPMAHLFLELHASAQERLGLRPRPEYYHQWATLAFQEDSEDADRSVRKYLKAAMRGLREVADYGQPKKPHEIDDIGLRHMHLLRPLDCEGADGLLDLQLRSYPADDIHIGLNVAATAACRLATDDLTLHQQALDLLDRHGNAGSGYLRTETSFRLLRLTPQLPTALRANWTRFALYQNAFDEPFRDSRYTNDGG